MDMQPTHVLIVDDDDLLRRSLAFNLEQAGYRVSTAASAEDALGLVRRDPPNLVLLDIRLPGMDGLDALPRFKQSLNCPVIFLTARRRELDEILGLELGADTPLKMPVQKNISVGDLEIDPAAHTVTVAGRSVELPPREFDLLHTLALEAGHVLSVEELLARVWGAEYQGEPQVVYVHIRWLREKIEEDLANPERILTIRGVGYKLESKEVRG
jgi:DNA-binding response OmpR family regulator